MTKTRQNRIFLIAEAGINHGGDMDTAGEMIEAASHAGVNAVKFQSFTAKGLTHETLANDQYVFFSRFELSRTEHARLAQLCRDAGMDFLSTPFDFRMADMLDELDVPAFKIASCDLTNLPLIEHVARFGKPMYISTGMGNVAEARQAYDCARDGGSPRVVMLQCTTNYPTAYPDVHLKAIKVMRDEIGCEVGFSDHSIGNYCCFAAAALGATVIEKHFCLDKGVEGPDIACSCDPAELADLVRGIRNIETALGSPDKRMADSERDIAAIARRSIFYSSDLPDGHTLTTADVAFLRPASGISPARIGELLGRRLVMDVEAGQAAQPEHFA